MRLVYLPSLYILFLVCVLFGMPSLFTISLYVWDSLLGIVLDAVYIALRVLLVLLSALCCGNFCLDAIYMRQGNHST